MNHKYDMIKSMAMITKDRQREIDISINQLWIDTGLTYPKNSLLEIAEKIGVEVRSMDLPPFDGKKVKGVIKWDENGKAQIYVSDSLVDTTKAFTIAHELGHFILHKGTENFRIDLFDYSSEIEPIETEANYFAAALLMPEENFKEILSLTNDKKIVAKFFGVSVPAVENRIKWMKTNS